MFAQRQIVSVDSESGNIERARIKASAKERERQRKHAERFIEEIAARLPPAAYAILVSLYQES